MGAGECNRENKENENEITLLNCIVYMGLLIYTILVTFYI